MTPVTAPAVILALVKICVLIGLIVYTIFAGIMVRQEQLMAHVIEESFEPALRLLTLIHAAAAIVVLLLAVVLI